MTHEDFKSCFIELFDSVRNYIFYRCNDADLATDITQEAFMKIWEKDFVYHPKKTKGLVYKIANELWISHYRKSKSALNYQLTLSQEDFKNENEQSQRHEIKASLNLWFRPITISIAGVYGSGFKSFSLKNEGEIKPYSRIDIALKYTKKLKKTSMNTGVSILNLLNTSNVRLFRTTNFSDNSSYSTLGLPFTPTLFFNLNF